MFKSACKREVFRRIEEDEEHVEGGGVERCSCSDEGATLTFAQLSSVNI